MTTQLTLIARLFGAALLSVAASACSGVAENSTSPVVSTPAPVAVAAPVKTSGPALTLMQQINAEIGAAACDTSAQCKTVAVGSKACGGPEAYLAYSTKRSDASKISRLAAADTAAKQAQNTGNGMVSTCSMVMDPGATCNAGRCVLSGGSRGELPVR